MSKHEKALKRLLSKPTDYSWRELKQIMTTFGYEMKTIGGSGRKFTQPGNGGILFIHEPHPGSILKAYQAREVIAFLKQEGHL